MENAIDNNKTFRKIVYTFKTQSFNVMTLFLRSKNYFNIKYVNFHFFTYIFTERNGIFFQSNKSLLL